MQKTNRIGMSGAALAGVSLCAVLCLPASAQRGASRPAPNPQSAHRTVAAPPQVLQSQPSRQEQPAFRAGQPGQAQPPIVRSGSPPIYRGQPQPGQNVQARPGHLGSWMQQHQNLSPQDQQRALEHEPGFNQLPPDQQARMRARLQQLNQMPPQQRAQVLNRVEGMERLTPEQRQHVNATMSQLRALPQNEKQQVTRAFGALRQMPPEQREAAARNMSAQMNPQQRDAFNNLIKAEPYLPIQRPPAPPPGGPVVQ